MSDAEHFFSESDKRQIADTIAQVETTTAGEIQVMVVDDSDGYPEAVLLGSLPIGGLLALIVTDHFFHDSLWVFIPSAVLAALLSGLLLRLVPRLKRLFVSPAHMEQRVRNRGALAFYAKGLHRTRDATGVLFFLSLFERKVWVLADSGIYQKLSQEELQAYTGRIVTGIRDGRQTEAICAELRRLGAVLARHFPIKPDDVNELPNEVIVEGRTQD